MSNQESEQVKIETAPQQEPEQISKSAEQEVQEKNPVKKKSSGHGVLYFALLLMIASSAGAGYYFWQLQLQQSQLLQVQQSSLASLSQKMQKMQAQLDSNQSTAVQQTSQLQQLNQQIKQTEDISQRAIEIVNRSQRGWALAEIDYLLRIAHQRLLVARDIGGAIAALKGADERLEQLGDLNLFAIRQQLSKDMAALNAIHQADVNGISLAIDQMIVYLPQLPFKSVKDEVKSQFTESDRLNGEILSVPSFVESVIETVKQIGDIKIHQRSIKAASSAQQQNEIEQLLRTYLLSARLAALRFNQVQFLHEIKQASELLSSYYDEHDNRIQQLQKNLMDYSVLQLSPDLPELTKAWNLLQKQIKNPTGLSKIKPQQIGEI